MLDLSLPLNAETVDRLGRVGVLLGGQSAEREVSLMSGHAILVALQNAGVNAHAIDINDRCVEQLLAADIDRAFIALHGPGGEDGRMQALLEFLNIPYTGSDVQSSALAMNKLHTKQLWCGIGLPTPEFAIASSGDDWDNMLSSLGGKAIVKPAHEGSSIGMRIVDTAEDLKDAFEGAAKLDHSVLVERLIEGAEYTVAILNGEALPPICLETDNVFYDYDAKYIDEDTRYICPCGLPADRENELKDLALQAFNSLACGTWGRVDFMADENGKFYLLEVNTVPGMTSHSLVPMAAREAGISFEQLVVSVLMETLK
jgi:D-alanine-D-alanine ligase